MWCHGQKFVSHVNAVGEVCCSFSFLINLWEEIPGHMLKPAECLRRFLPFRPQISFSFPPQLTRAKYGQIILFLKLCVLHIVVSESFECLLILKATFTLQPSIKICITAVLCQSPLGPVHRPHWSNFTLISYTLKLKYTGQWNSVDQGLYFFSQFDVLITK